VFSEIAKQDPKSEAAIKTGFDNAVLAAAVLLLREGAGSKGVDSADVLQLAEELREITFPNG
jgi:hypothetical protein